MSASSQYHDLLPSLQNLVTYVSEKVCSTDDCRDKTSSLLSASYVDFDYDSISHALIINVFWAEGPANGGLWNEEVSRGEADTMEVGVLNNEVPIEPEELSLSGFLTVVGEDKKASACSDQPRRCLLLTLLRTHLILLPIAPSSTSLDRSSGSPDLLHHIQSADRPPPHSPPLLPKAKENPHAAWSIMRATHISHSPLHLLSRQIPIFRPPLPRFSQPAYLACPSGCHRSRGPRLDCAPMGQCRAF